MRVDNFLVAQPLTKLVKVSDPDSDREVVVSLDVAGPSDPGTVIVADSADPEPEVGGQTFEAHSQKHALEMFGQACEYAGIFVMAEAPVRDFLARELHWTDSHPHPSSLSWHKRLALRLPTFDLKLRFKEALRRWLFS